MVNANATLLSKSRVNRLLDSVSADLRRAEPATKTRLHRQAETLDRLSHEVRTNWESMDPQLRDRLSAIAYMEPQHVSRFRAFASRVSWAITFLKDADGFFAFMAAGSRFHDAILTAIENSNPLFQDELSAALADLNLDELVGAPLEAGREHEYLAGL